MKPLLDLNPSDCRWPVTDDRPFLFCGEPKAPESSYCACHKRMSVSADQPIAYRGHELTRVANYFGGGRAKQKQYDHSSEVRQRVDTAMAVCGSRPLSRDFFPKEAAE